MNDFAKINEVYAKYFTEPLSGSFMRRSRKIPKDVLLEVETIVEL